METVPDGERVDLPGRGTTFVRDVPGPPGAPTVVLLHGLAATARLNWPGALDALSPWFRVVAVDHRGHGRGIRSARPFRLRDCADDVVALADVLGIDELILAGYSMGGPIALQAAHRHPERVAGLVMCATAARFGGDDDSRRSPLVTAMTTSLRLTPGTVRHGLSATMIDYLAKESGMPPSYVAEIRRHDPAAIAEASQSIVAFDARSWAGGLDVPAVSIVTERDQLVPRSRQIELAHALGASIIPIPGDHFVAVSSPDRFLPALVMACRDVAGRVDRRRAG